MIETNNPPGYLEVNIIENVIHLNARGADGSIINLGVFTKENNENLKGDFYHTIGTIPVAYEVPGLNLLNSVGRFVLRAPTQNVRAISFSILCPYIPKPEQQRA